MKIPTFQKILMLGAVPLVMAIAPSANAAQAMTPQQINAQHDAAMKHCRSMKGNDKDVCEKKADAQRDAAKADAKASSKEAEARHDAMKEKREGAYDVAKEKCDAMSGDAKDQCIAEAKTKYGK